MGLEVAPGVLCIIRERCTDPMLRGSIVEVLFRAYEGDVFRVSGNWVLISREKAPTWAVKGAAGVLQYSAGPKHARSVYEASVLPIKESDLQPIAGPQVDMGVTETGEVWV